MNTTVLNSLDKDIVEFIQSCMKKEHPKSYLIAVLHMIQERYGYLSKNHMNEAAHLLQIPTSTVSGVSTFYHYFRLKPVGVFRISVCMGTACFVKGSDLVLEAFKNEIGIDLGDVTADGIFSLENARCLGVCALAPVVTINEEVYSNLTPTQVPMVIKNLKARAKEMKELEKV